MGPGHLPVSHHHGAHGGLITEILAAYTLAGNLDKISTVVIFALANAAAILVGREIGRGTRSDRVYSIGSALNLIALLLGLAVAGVMIVLTLTLADPLLYPISTSLPQPAASLP